MKQEIWVFDFDKTLTKADTTLPLLVHGCRLPAKIIRKIQYYLLAVLVKLSLIDHKSLKNKLFSRYFGGWPKKQWEQHCADFARSISFNSLYYSIAWDNTEKQYWVVSASPLELVRNCFPGSVHVLATEMLFTDQGFMGLALHMHGRIKKLELLKHGISQVDRFYSDHYFDSAVAAIAKEVFLVQGDKVELCDNAIDFYKKSGGKTLGFMLTSCPPARTSVNLWGVISGMGDSHQLEQEMASSLGSMQVLIGDAWVNVLAEGLRCLAASSDRNEVILPAYSCNEFTKAILLAELTPVYAPLNHDGKMYVSSFQDLVNKNTLAVLAVNNTGVVSDLAELRNYCDQHAIWLVEDAGYTFLGKDKDGRPFGSFGHAAVINLSEGKTIPCGGAAWALNDKRTIEAFAPLAKHLAATSPHSNLREMISLLIYSSGSTIIGFTAYRILKSLIGKDLKSLFSAEPSRTNENYATGNLYWHEGNIMMDAYHEKHLKSITIRPWNRIRKSCAIQILHKAESIRHIRKTKRAEWKNALGDTFQWIDLPDNAMPVKQPFMLPGHLFELAETEKLAWQGVKKQYPPTWPMAGIGSEHDKSFYEQVYTLPLHDGVSRKRIKKLAGVLKKRF